MSREHRADFSAHIFYFNTSHIFAYLWITILRQDLQHRRFSALNVSHKNQFTSHHQRLCISPFLHDPHSAPEDLFSRKWKRQTAEQPSNCCPSLTEKPGGSLSKDARSWSDWICHCGALYRQAAANRSVTFHRLPLLHSVMLSSYSVWEDVTADISKYFQDYCERKKV